MANESFFPGDTWSRRTIADALDVLSGEASFDPHGTTVILVRPVKLTWGDRIGKIQLCHISDEQNISAVELPWAENVRILDNNNHREIIDVFDLDDSLVDPKGEITLRNGRRLRQVEVCKLNFPLIPTPLHFRVIRTLLKMNNAQESCTIPLSELLPAEAMDPRFKDARIINCRALPGLPAPRLKEIVWQHRQLHGEAISSQAAADALKLFGIRTPQKRRPRSKSSTNKTPENERVSPAID